MVQQLQHRLHRGRNSIIRGWLRAGVQKQLLVRQLAVPVVSVVSTAPSSISSKKAKEDTVAQIKEAILSKDIDYINETMEDAHQQMMKKID